MKIKFSIREKNTFHLHCGLLFICLSVFLFFSSCKTPSVEKKHFSVSKELSAVNQADLSRSAVSNSEQKLKIYFPQFFDEQHEVFEGDGVVIILPDNKVVVIDGFVPKAEKEYIAFIKKLAISKIDYLIGTHYHNDHIGTFPDLIDSFEIGIFYSNGAPIKNPESVLLQEKLLEKKINQIVLKEGDEIAFTEDCGAKIFWPNLSEQDLYDVMYNRGKTEAKINLTSLVTKIIYKDFSIMFPGDIYKKGEKQLVQKYGSELHSTILKASHHGEWYTANWPKFVKTVNSDYGIIQDNRYITSVINRVYKKAGSPILYRLTPGYILIETNGHNYSISESSF